MPPTSAARRWGPVPRRPGRAIRNRRRGGGQAGRLSVWQCADVGHRRGDDLRVVHSFRCPLRGVARCHRGHRGPLPYASTVGGFIVAAVALAVSIPVSVATVVFYIAFRLGEDYLLTPKSSTTNSENGRLLQLPSPSRQPRRPDTLRTTTPNNPGPAVTDDRQSHMHDLVSHVRTFLTGIQVVCYRLNRVSVSLIETGAGANNCMSSRTNHSLPVTPV